MTEQSSVVEDYDLKLQISNSEEDSQYEDDEVDTDGNEDDELSKRETGTESENENENDTINNSEQLSSSEWVEFNKQVILMRPLFKSAKVQFVHKASRSIKILRKKKGTPEQVQSNNKKADRLVQEIAYINRLKKDVIAKFALLHSKEEVTRIVNSADSTMEYRVKAKVASSLKISKAAEDYHLKHPDWRDSLFKLIQLAGKNMKKKRRKIRGKSNRGSKINEENRQNAKKQQSKKFLAREEDDVDSERFGVSNFPEPPPGLEDSVGKVGAFNEENSRDGTGSEEEDDDDDAADEEQPGSDDESASEGVGLILRTFKSKPERTVPQNSGIRSVHEQAVKGQRNLGKRATKKTIPGKHKLASVHEVSAKVNDKKEKPRNSEEPCQDIKFSTQGKGLTSKRPHSGNSSDEEDDGEPESKPIANVDPFFMTSDNKEYKTLWKVEPADSFKNKKPNEPEFMFKNARSFKDVLSGKNKKGLSKAKVSRHDKKDKKAGGGKGQQPEVPLENLHPSWQAKKKMSGVAFQGKKVVFDDD